MNIQATGGTMKRVRAVRGATTVQKDERQEILLATKEMFSKIIEENRIKPDDLVSAIFTVTPDLTAAFPAEAVRLLGYTKPPLLDTMEMQAPGALPKCIRVLIHYYTKSSLEEIHHVYLHEAKKLRPDWAK
jgi:chorismate mutase